MSLPLRSLYIYLTDRCNLSCTHCWQSAPYDEFSRPPDLSLDACEAFLDQAMNMGLRDITFSGGEPLLNREFGRFCRYFGEHNVQMAMETNGMMIPHNGHLDAIREHSIYCAVSLDGATPKVHNAQRGNRHAFSRTVRALDTLEAAGVTFQVIMAISKQNHHELVPLLDFISERYENCDVVKINVTDSIGRAQEMEAENLLFAPAELPRLTEEVGGLIDKYPFAVILHVDPAFFSYRDLGRCYSCGGHCGYKVSLSVLANGNVSICSLGKEVKKYVFGHVSSIKLREIWESHPLLCTIHGDNLHLKLNGVCGRCIFRKDCLGGCRALAVCTYGDFFAPHPTCQSYYEAGEFPKARLIDGAKSSQEYLRPGVPE